MSQADQGLHPFLLKMAILKKLKDGFFVLESLVTRSSARMLHLTHLNANGSAQNASWATVGWSAFVILSLIAGFIAMEAPAPPLLLLGAGLAVLFAYRYPYATYGLFVACVPLLGLTISLSTGELAIGSRAFGGAIDISVGEVVAMTLLAAWALKVFMLWLRRSDISWKPWMPLVWPVAALVGAHMLSAWSPFAPDRLLVFKYAIRPVLWSYLLYVLLTVNIIRTRRRLMMALGVVAATGLASALMGFISLGLPGAQMQLLPRAHPLGIFGFMPLGDNHNQLAEWLAVTVPSTLALALLSLRARTRRLLVIAALFQLAIALLTFARTVWIVFAFQALCAGWFVWRDAFAKWIRPALIGAVILLPVAGAMTAFSSSALVQSSTTTRVVLTEIAWSLWTSSPWLGVGAGTFVDRVSATWIFATEFGAPLDAHGLLQKILAETGLIGLAALAWLVAATIRFIQTTRAAFASRRTDWQIFTLLAISTGGALLYQLFNTNYWSGKMWLPLGLMLAAARALQRVRAENSEEKGLVVSGKS